MNVVCDGAGNLGLIVLSGTKYLLRKAGGGTYTLEMLFDGQYSGGTTTMATFDNDPETFEWHDHEFGWLGSEFAIQPELEEWTE